MQIKPGDKVKCINNLPITSVLVIGKFYTIDKIVENKYYNYKNRILIKEIPGLMFYEDRFEFSIVDNRRIKLEELYEKHKNYM